MAIQMSVGLRTVMINQIEANVGASPRLHIRTGAVPANCAAADAGTLLVNIGLPANWLADAANGAVSKVNTWTANAEANGAANHWRIKDSSNTTCHLQGTANQGTGDMSLDNVNIANGQAVTITTFTLTMGNA